MEPYRNTELTPKERAADLLPRMTLREKVGQINQRLYGFQCYRREGSEFELTEECCAEISRWSGLGVLYGLYRADPWSGRTEENGVPPELAPKLYNLVQRRVLENSRFSIPVLMSSECPHGHQTLGSYLLPVNLAAGACFNPGLLEEAFAVCGAQMKAQGVHLGLLSVLDVLRDPRWGRSEECYGEDPYLSRILAAAAVRGCTRAGVEAVAKHLCAQGETTGGINSSAARIGPRELREIHLPPVWAVLEEGAAGLMAAYNEIDGIPCHANRWLLRDFLRDEAGFKGFVMADGTALDRLDEITGDNTLSGALALKSGIDISLWDSAFSRLEEAVQSGAVQEERLDEAVFRVLECKFRLGLFEHPYMDEDSPVRLFSAEEYPQSLEMARQSIVLLQNKDTLLPLSREARTRIAVIGPNADNLYAQLGDYTPPVPAESGCTLLQGLTSEAGSGITLEYLPGCDLFTGTESQLEAARRLAENSDLVIVCLGGSSSRFGEVRFDNNGAAIPGSSVQMDCGEGVDRADLELPDCQLRLFETLVQTGKPIIAAVIAGRPYALPSVSGNAKALLYAFYPGPWGGKALAEIIFGSTQPSGRLPVSLPRSSAQLPCWYNGKYSQKIRSYCDTDSSPLFPFGAGTGYTSFEYRDVRAEKKERGIVLSCTISNTGTSPGYAVPMIFIRWQRGTITARRKELKQFAKLRLEPGQAQILSLEISSRDLERWDPDMVLRPGTGPVLIMLEDGANLHWSGEVLY
ncbi:glycoside hydrolase family 3 N-terminal domain-containing protein [Breznakiella homolactica]|uniref:Glycoside hydrolase family 3 C-terminal domain-containing protein n=1 Tax=Breznakiella homolactica TaxID=2798577 RepID=A0A7T8BAT7_9SPIR|nr:glycoside hydrolase family 3 N-terminal domain-containing protein [Breznakiella homolactica]QQO08493.1 glycoside hydrolase family 3 C-terminal domain-containing protein [Breznakiella homolactica]